MQYLLSKIGELKKLSKDDLLQLLSFVGAFIVLAFVYQNPIGMVFLFITFVATRYHYKGKLTYHKWGWLCIKASIILFAVGGLWFRALPINVSILAAVPIGIAMTWYLHDKRVKEKQYFELLKIRVENNRLLKALECPSEPRINVYALSEDELRKACSERNLTVIDEDIVVYKIIERMRNVEIRKMMGYSHNAFYSRLKKIKTVDIFSELK